MYAFFMSVFRTLFLVLFFQFSLVVPTIAGTIDPVMDLSRQFALCLGRYSAEMEHRFLLGESADQSIASRDLFEDLLFAVEPDISDLGVNEARILSLRIEANTPRNGSCTRQLSTVITVWHVMQRRARCAKYGPATCLPCADPADLCTILTIAPKTNRF
jgi:hypothetical protein